MSIHCANFSSGLTQINTLRAETLRVYVNTLRDHHHSINTLRVSVNTFASISQYIARLGRTAYKGSNQILVVNISRVFKVFKDFSTQFQGGFDELSQASQLAELGAAQPQVVLRFEGTSKLNNSRVFRIFSRFFRSIAMHTDMRNISSLKTILVKHFQTFYLFIQTRQIFNIIGSQIVILIKGKYLHWEYFMQEKYLRSELCSKDKLQLICKFYYYFSPFFSKPKKNFNYF